MNRFHIIHHIHEVKSLHIEKAYNLVAHLQKNETLLVYVRRGRGVLKKSGAGTSLVKRDLIMLSNDYSPKDIYIEPSHTMQLFCITFMSASVKRDAHKWLVEEHYFGHSIMNDVKKLNHGLLSYHEEALYTLWKDKENTEEWCGLFQHRFNQLVEEMNTYIQDDFDIKDDQPWERFKAYFDHHFDEPIHIHDLVKSSGLNITTFYHEFKRYTGYAPLQYITQKRIEKAKYLLLTSVVSIADIASEVGYQDMYYFSRIFKQTVGISPKKFSQLCRKKFYVLAPVFAVDLLTLGVTKKQLYPLSETNVKTFLVEAKQKSLRPIEVRHSQPDCIICQRERTQSIDQLEEVAPTSLISYKNMNWRAQLVELATVIGSKNLAIKWLQQFDKRLAIVRKQVKHKFGRETVIAIRILDGKIRIFGEKRRKLSDFLYRELHLTPPDFIKECPFCDIELDEEKLACITSDHILLLTDDKITNQQVRYVKKNLKGSIYEVNGYPWLSYSAWGHERMLQEVFELFI